jgi:starch synthase
MNIVHVSSEVYPFSKTGGLADVVGTLPLRQASLGESVAIFSPAYLSVISRRKSHLTQCYKSWAEVGKHVYEFDILTLRENSVDYYFFFNEYLFGREGIYGNNRGDFPDNTLRYFAFCKAVINFILSDKFSANIIHCHDWQTSFIPLLLDKIKTKKPKVFLSIHNLAFQGINEPKILDDLGIDKSYFHVECLEYFGRVNFLKAAIVLSNKVGTVSPSYAEEIKSKEFGFGLDGVLRKYSYKLVGILNGIDYNLWNPQTDKYIYKTYSADSLEKKDENKYYFASEFGFESKKPLFAIVSRLTHQKGMELVIKSLQRGVFRDYSLLVLGDGDEDCCMELKKFSDNSDDIFFIRGFREPLSRRVYASADFYLMPSVFEPCGISQLIALRYGTLPVVRKTGGLKDTVIDINEKGGYGFVFEDFNIDAFIKKIEEAKHCYQNRKKLNAFRKTAMSQDFSWKKSAEEYLNVYYAILRS